MPLLSDSFSRIGESQTVALTGLLAKLRREGRDVVALGAGEPDFDTPDTIKNAAIDAIPIRFYQIYRCEAFLECARPSVRICKKSMVQNTMPTKYW
jgi:aspartate/methionine/tyrosine aminotransferase